MICYKFSNYQKNWKMLQSLNTTNSDLLTVVSLNTQLSNESLISNNINTYAGDFCNFHIMFIVTSFNSTNRNAEYLVNEQNKIKN